LGSGLFCGKNLSSFVVYEIKFYVCCRRAASATFCHNAAVLSLKFKYCEVNSYLIENHASSLLQKSVG